MSTALAERPAGLPADQIELIRRTVAKDATNDELALFLYDCQRRGIHPLDKLLHFTKRSGRYTPVTSIDFMRAQAAMSGEMAGSDDPAFLNAESGRPESATVTVYRMTQGQRFAYSATARWAEYCPDTAPMWKRMPHTMLGKCAEALALRKAFPQQLAGLYSREEMDQADEPKGYVVEAPPPVERPQPSNAAPPASDDDSPDIGVDLPPGARLILRVGPGRASAKAELTFNAPLPEANTAVLLTWKESLKALAEQLCQNREPCFVGLKRSVSGNWRVEDLTRVPQDYDPPEGLPQPAEPLTADEIPF